MAKDMRRSVVVTGASAGVGRAIAVAFGLRGWNVALLAREPAALDSAAREVEEAGGRALAIPLDVVDAPAQFAAAERVVRTWGVIDVWINNAMTTLYAPVVDISPDEFRRVTEVTYLGYVYGTMAALRHMRGRDAGTIVQVGSALSYRAIPLQSAYCGAKFAIRGFTDALRCELLHDGSRVRITMVQLPAVNTPQFDWARNKMACRPQPVPPIHQPEAAAAAVLRAAISPPRESWVGLVSVKAIIGTMIAPGTLDRLLARRGYDAQFTSETKDPHQRDNLFVSLTAGHHAHGRFDDRARDDAAVFNSTVVRVALALAGAATLVIGAVVAATIAG